MITAVDDGRPIGTAMVGIGKVSTVPLFSFKKKENQSLS